MKIIDNGYFVIGFIVLFILWVYSLKYACPCDNVEQSFCTRVEFYGVQYNHFVLFLLLGFTFPSYFYTFLILGILWELYEYILHLYPRLVYKQLGGCLMERPKNKHWNPPYFYYVYRDEPKYYNIIDRVFGIHNSTIYTWHHSIAEIIPNIIGFLLGKYIHHLVN